MSKYTRYRRSQMGPRIGDFALGSLESRAAARAVLLAHDQEIQEQEAELLKNMTPFELEFLKASGRPLKPSYALHLICEAITKRSELFGWPLPTPVKVRHEPQISKEVEEIDEEMAGQEDTEVPDE